MKGATQMVTSDRNSYPDPKLVTQLVPGSPSAPRSTIPACSLELTQYPGPWYRENALGSRVERAWVSVDSQWGAAVGTGVEGERRILVEGALCARSQPGGYRLASHLAAVQIGDWGSC